MALSLTHQIELAAQQLVSSNTGPVTFNQTEVLINDADYDGNPTCTFVIVCNNLDTVARNVELVDTLSNVYATIQVPAGTGTATLSVLFKSLTFSLAAGLTTYKVKLPQTSSNTQITVYKAVIAINQTNATKTRLQFPMIGSNSNGVQNDYILRTNSTAFNQGASADNWRHFIKESSKYGATIVNWSLEACAAGTLGGDVGECRLRNISTGNGVAGALITNISGTSFKVYNVDFSNGAADFVDGDEHEVQIRRVSGSGNCEINRVALYIRITGLNKALVYLLLSYLRPNVASNITATNTRVHFRRNDFSTILTEKFEVDGDLDSGTQFDVILFNAGANDSGGSGSDVIGSNIVLNGARSNQRVTLPELNDARYMVKFVETGTSVVDLFFASLLIEVVSPQLSAGVHLVTLYVTDQSANESIVEVPVFVG